MKKIAFITFAFSLLIACRDDKQTPLSDNAISADLNGIGWSAVMSVSFDLNSSDSLRFQAVTNHPNDEVMNLIIKFQGVGSYELTGQSASYYTTVGGDVLSSEYVLDTSVPSHFEITEYAADTKTVEGNFKLVFKKKRGQSADSEILNFKNGKFKGTIKN
jgi:hypothetical protein